MEFVLGDLIWIFPHDELSWCPGEICKVESEAYITIAKDSNDESLYRIEKNNAYPVHPSCLQKVPDLLSLGEFNEGALLHNIRCRYMENQIYTSVGSPILISLNPYAKLPLYSDKISISNIDFFNVQYPRSTDIPGKNVQRWWLIINQKY